jgi:sugar phosphate isomerase/epimerase
VALCSWPIRNAAIKLRDPRARSLDALFQHVVASGYDGVEMAFDDFDEAFFGVTAEGKEHASWPAEKKAAAVREAADRWGVRVFGSTTHVQDQRDVAEPERRTNGVPRLDFQDPAFEEKLRRALRLDKMLGHEYTSFQLWLPPRYLNDGGAYRNDKAYLSKVAQRVARLRRIVHEEGLNCYVETHVDRVSEDIWAFDEILARVEGQEAPREGKLELNGDLSHYIYKGIERGRALEGVLSRVNHMHVRMARQHGDLSAELRGGSPAVDWERSDGVTRRYYEYALPSLQKAGGLSSRVIAGETGPMHLVEDPLTLDAQLVPLLRKMCATADRAARRSAAEAATGLPHA